MGWTTSKTLAAAFIGVMAWGGQAAASTFCVATADDFSAALLAAQQDTAGSDEIRLRSGTYAAPDGGWQIDVQLRGITIGGGYTDAACQTASGDAAATVLDGRHATPVLSIATSFAPQQVASGIVVRGVTIANGAGTQVAGLKVSDGGPIYNGLILIEGNIFRDNVASAYEEDNSAGALLAATDGSSSLAVDLIVRNNLFVGNRAPNAAAAMLFSNNAIVVTGNSVSGNQAFDMTLTSRTAVATFTFSPLTYSNNVFWANNPDALAGTFDLRADSPFGATLGADLIHDDLQAVLGTPHSQSGTLSLDPQFADAASGDFRPGAASPLIDAGLDAPIGGQTAADLAGNARIQGASVDIGAYELDRVFADGFE